MNPLVSIIIPTYNRAHLISETLDSVVAQSYINWECIIVDDGSTDNSLEIFVHFNEKDRRFFYYDRPNSKLKGPSSCRNYGVEKSKGEYVIFLDSDDLLSITCLQDRINFALQNLQFDFWIFKMVAFIKNTDNIKFVYKKMGVGNESIYCRQEFMKGNHPFVITAPLWKKNVLIELKGFMEKMTMIEDPELHLRSLKKGYQLKFANFETPDCFYRQKISSNFRKSKTEVKNNYIFFNLHLEKNEKDSIFYFKKMFNILIFDNLHFKYFFLFSFLAYKKGIFNHKIMFFGTIIIFYHLTKLAAFKGIGYNYFKTQFNNF